MFPFPCVQSLQKYLQPELGPASQSFLRKACAEQNVKFASALSDPLILVAVCPEFPPAGALKGFVYMIFIRTRDLPPSPFS